MAVMAIAHKPDLTMEQVQEVFRKRFEPKYRVEALKGLHGAISRRNFMVVKNPFIAASVRLEQSEGETKFVYSGVVPRWWARLFSVAVLIGSLINWTGLTNEVAELTSLPAQALGRAQRNDCQVPEQIVPA